MSKFTKDELHALKKLGDAVKAKDANIDIAHIADYLWTWTDNMCKTIRRIMDDEMNKTNAETYEEAAKKAYPKAKAEFEKVYKSLQNEVNKRLKLGYELQLKTLEMLKNQK